VLSGSDTRDDQPARVTRVVGDAVVGHPVVAA
jgi:hypothetical protein